jgi:hypothetical protein
MTAPPWEASAADQFSPGRPSMTDALQAVRHRSELLTCLGSSVVATLNEVY